MEISLATLRPDELEYLFKFIASTRLLRFRQVSKEWNVVAQLVLRKRHDIGITLNLDYDIPHNFRFLEFLRKFPGAFVGPVLEIKSKEDGDVTHINLQEGVVHSSVEIIGEICKLLGNRDGNNNTRKLITSFCSRTPPPSSATFLLLILRHLSPNLESLLLDNISDVDVALALSEELYTSAKTLFTTAPFISLKRIAHDVIESDADLTEFSRWLRLILESSPNLTKISGCCMGSTEWSPIPVLFELGRLPKMTELTLVTAEDFKILLQCQPQPKIGVLEANCEEVEIEELQKFIVKQSQNLKNLSIIRPIGSIPSRPKFPLLTNLNLTCGVTELGPISLSFANDTPNLRHLRVCVMQFGEEDTAIDWKKFFSQEENAQTGACRSLKVLDMDFDTEDPEFLTFIASTFPNVVKLLWHNPTELEIRWICTTWWDLEVLMLNYSNGWRFPEKKLNFGLDQALFGITDEWKNGIDTEEEEWWNNVTSPEPDTPTVGNLKNLRVLHVITCDMEENDMTDFSVYFGLRKLQHLEKIFIRGFILEKRKYTNHKVSPAAVEFIIENFPKLEKLVLGDKKMHDGEMIHTDNIHIGDLRLELE